MFGDSWERARDIFYDAFRGDHLAHVVPMPGAAEALLAGCGVARGASFPTKRANIFATEVVHL